MTRSLRGKGTIKNANSKTHEDNNRSCHQCFQAQKKAIDTQIAELPTLLMGNPEMPAEEASATQPKRKFSAAAIKRMSEHKTCVGRRPRASRQFCRARPCTLAKRKGGITAEGRKALSIAMKKRWAPRKAASGQSASVEKKAARKKAA